MFTLLYLFIVLMFGKKEKSFATHLFYFLLPYLNKNKIKNYFSTAQKKIIWKDPPNFNNKDIIKKFT